MTPLHTRPLPEISEVRRYRLDRRVRLVDAALAADLAPSRVSEIERHPDVAKTFELDRLRDAVDRIVASRGEGIAA